MKFSDAALQWMNDLLESNFGCRFTVVNTKNEICISLENEKRIIRFDNLESIFHESRSDFPCYQWQASTEGFTAPIDDKLSAPSETELPSPLVEVSERGAVIHYDILGLMYWMLTRLEEVGRTTDLDNHQRFPATSSHAYEHGYLERPIVDEWLMILGQVIQRVWPQIKIKQHEFKINVSHDVDNPSLYAFKTWSAVGRMMAVHLLKRHDLKAFVTAPRVKLGTQNQLHLADPCNTFDWLMDVSEANNLRSAFYFICGRTDQLRDADYEPEHPVIRNLMRRIHERGHEIGLHPSYNTFQKPELMKQEADRLKRICSEERIEQAEWGGRMHYLRWEQPTTLRAWEIADMSYDSTMSYADRPGFRCGTCHEYPAFDPVSQEQLKVRIRPLIVMECTVIDPVYLGLGASEAAVDKIKLLKERCRQVAGDFNILWHNSYFKRPELKSMYQQCLRT